MPRTLRDALNEANPNHVPDGLQRLPAGEAFGLIPRTEVVSIVSNVATLSVPALRLISVYGQTAAAYATIVAPEATPAAGEATVNAKGQLAYTVANQVAEVTYIPVEGTIVTEVVQVAASVGSFLGGKKSQKVLSVEVVTGLVLGAKGVLARAATATSGNVSLRADGSGVSFNAADVVTGTARVTYVATPTQTVGARLGSTVVF